MTPSQYPEKRFRNRQGDPRWASRRLGRTSSTMARFGCVVTAVAYLISRHRGQELTPGDWLTWLNAHAGFDVDRFKWSKVDVFTNGALRYTTDPRDKTYALRNVLVPARDSKGRRIFISHWVVELRGALMFDPLDGQIKALSAYRPVLNPDKSVNRRYYLAKVKPVT